MLWVHATINGEKLLCSVDMRYRETLEEAMGRGVSYLLVGRRATYATGVWTETLDAYNAEVVMDGGIPGVRMIPTGAVRMSG